MRGLCVAGIGLVLLAGGARAGDLSAALPTKAPPPAAPAAYDWTGFYLGGHVGYALGASNWSSTQTGGAAPAVNGSFDFSNGYNFFTGTGSYFLGFQAGYDYHDRVALAVRRSKPAYRFRVSSAATGRSPRRRPAR